MALTPERRRASESGHPGRVDIRRKTFVAETVARFAFLLHEHGFAEPQTTQHGEFPTLLAVRYGRADFEVEVSLIQSYAGEEHIDTSITAIGADSSIGRTEVGSDTVRTGFQTRQALDRQAQALSQLLTRKQPRE
jgi:hypothetical protein